jgi:hypothetical protein
MGGGGGKRAQNGIIEKNVEFPANRQQAVRIQGFYAENANFEAVSRTATAYLLYHGRSGSGKS